MPLKVPLPADDKVIEVDILSQDAFSSFGTVIENPAPSTIPAPRMQHVPTNAVQANQGTALKYLDVTHMKNYYGIGTGSKRPGTAVMNMFVCAPRRLIPSLDPKLSGLFSIEILERHPYTTQTFIPIGLSTAEASRARYLVIVAPSLHPPTNEHFPIPPLGHGSDKLPGQRLPDISKIKAFIAHGSQAVTYGAGIW
jgi:ureidoglycolate lyase